MIDYLAHVGVLMGVAVILSVGLDLALGYTGLLNLGHVAFYGIGAYTSALLVKAGAPFLVALPAIALLTALFGALLVLATRKLKGDYLALATLGFAFVTYSVLLNWQSLTRGPMGLPGIPKPELFGLAISSNIAYLLFTTIIAVLGVLFALRLTRSPFGRLMQATRDDELGARVLGKNTDKVKVKAMMISAAYAGIAGSLIAHYLTYIDPSSFYLSDIIVVVTMVIVGGISSVRGAVTGALLITLLPELLRLIALPASILGPARQMLYAVILVAIVLLRPRGIFGRVDLA